jgi:ankyrin repeat protein
MEAVDVGNPKIVELLLEMGADIQAMNNRGEKALDYAIRTNQSKIAKILNRNNSAECQL